MGDSPTFLLTGTYSSSNKGDAAMQLATARAIRATWPEATVLLSAPFAKADQAFYKDLTVVPSTRRRLVFGSVQVLQAWLYSRLARSGVTLRPLVASAELDAFERADVIIDLSGDMLTEDYGPHVTYSHFLPLLAAFALGKPVIVLAQSIGPFRSMRRLARFVLARAAKITVRDEITLDLLRRAGIEHHDLELTADMAFLLEAAAPAFVDELLVRDNIEWPEQPVLGVSVSNLICQHHRRAHPSAAPDSFVVEIAAVLDRAIEELGASVVFISHVTGPKSEKDDRRVAHRVHQQMRRGDRATVLDGDYRPDELKG